MMTLKLDDVARSLDVSSSTVERWIRQGRVPIRREGVICRLDKAVMDRWARDHSLTFAPPETGRVQEGKDALPQTLTAAISAGGTLYDCPGRTAREALRGAADRMAFLTAAQQEILYENLMERESLASTGVGKGVAIPHPRQPIPAFPESPVIVTCFLERPVDFKAVDDRPVFVMFLLLSPTVKAHLHLLSRLSFCLRDPAFIDFLQARPGEAELLEQVEGFERRLDSADSR
jgi:PTS system nitrogen regulatory IIA component